MVEPRHSAFMLNAAEYDEFLTERYRVAIALVGGVPPRNVVQAPPFVTPPRAAQLDARQQYTVRAWERACRLSSGTAYLLSDTQARLARHQIPGA
jgi:hypothetical protein